MKEYLRKWDLKLVDLVAQTTTANLYLVNSQFGDAILKVFTDIGRVDEGGGTLFLKNMQGRSCAKLYASDEGAQLLEFLPGRNLNEFSKSAQEDKATDVFVQVIKKIQSSSYNGLPSYEFLFKEFDKVTFPTHLNEQLAFGKSLSKKLLETQTQTVLLHGDLHHENIMQNEAGEYVCLDPKGMAGDPAYEIGAILKNPWGLPKISQNLELFNQRVECFVTELGLDRERVVGFAYVHFCLSLLWAVEDGYAYQHQESLINMIFERVAARKVSR
ncbi:aminoglycoside/hydroxyurea antibiotic resistance kinase [Bacteriovorax sp. BAL6_X]|uniref:aminoglycoside phosphotransferase family protein n=1 Tax=Bacteriovorax sp. BAL6_X TaxID=1201290 RepID=UPI000386914C|nr:aminoglycoside phosphotransferase family protein [Bacteriovorax sp. BAL6_X]EPZ49257.1 aminoglycoside/hydroxyurea antibiotic resistance kinase [Bacteriovorax sp. BAL6_X]